VFAPKDKIGDWLEMYTKVMELNYWTSERPNPPPTMTRQGMDRQGQARRQGSGAETEAAGPGDRHVRQVPNIPTSPVRTASRATSSIPAKHPGPDKYQAARRSVVIGSNNSAHDICAALWETIAT
jgi:putative flavoprotein involved in K+ transport